MRHGMNKTKLGRSHNHQLALRRNLAFCLLTHGKMRTTLAKAKLIQPVVEKLITMAKKGAAAPEEEKQLYIRNLSSFFTSGQNKRIYEELPKKQQDELRKKLKADRANGVKAGTTTEKPRVVKKLLTEIAPVYANRPGGYTRIYKLVTRLGDNAKMAIISLV